MTSLQMGVVPGEASGLAGALGAVLATLQMVAARAVEVFEESKRPLETRTTVTRTRTTKQGVEVTETTTVRRAERSGDVKPLRALLQCVDRELRVLKSFREELVQDGLAGDSAARRAATDTAAVAEPESAGHAPVEDDVRNAREITGPVETAPVKSPSDEPAFNETTSGTAERPLDPEPSLEVLNRLRSADGKREPGRTVKYGRVGLEEMAAMPPLPPTTRRGRLREALDRLAGRASS